MEGNKQTEKAQTFATEEEYHKTVYDVLYVLWEHMQLNPGTAHEGRRRKQKDVSESDESDSDKQEAKTPPSSEELKKKFASALEEQTPQEIRKILNATLTTLEFDPSEETMDLIEAILRHEQQGKTFVDSLTLPSCVFCKSDGKQTNCRVGFWQGDITTLKIDSIVNAANAYMLGCFTPGHACIDNVIHCRAGPRLRQECRVIMDKQGTLEETGTAKLTKAYCLPSKFVLHTVGPIVQGTMMGRGKPTPNQKLQLASCYRECLDAAKNEKDIRSIAFCCISTGVFGYPQDLAAEVALATVKEWLEEGDNAEHLDLVLFNVFTNNDLHIYEDKFPRHFPDKKEEEGEVKEEEKKEPQQPKEQEETQKEKEN